MLGRDTPPIPGTDPRPLKVGGTAGGLFSVCIDPEAVMWVMWVTGELSAVTVMSEGLLVDISGDVTLLGGSTEKR